MKAWYYEEFGSSDVLKTGDISIRPPVDDEVQVKIIYAGCNPVDFKIRKGLLQAFQPYQFPLIPGWEGTGIVSAVGNKVSYFKVGDEVFGTFRIDPTQWGTYAEYALAKEAHLAKKDPRLESKVAGAISIASYTAWEALFEEAQVKHGDIVLIHAGAGGVGHFAIQLARAKGCTVITTARLENHAYVKQLGAHHAIDYTTGPLDKQINALYPQGIDMVLDSVGKAAWENIASYVKPNGVVVSIVDRTVREGIPPQIRTKYLFAAPKRVLLEEVQRQILTGKLTPPLIEELPFEKAKEAQERLETRHVRGKLVLSIGS